MCIEVCNLSFSYGERTVLHNINFQVQEGKFLSILGPNGVGKSTLFRCVLGLLSGYQGQVFINGRDASKLSVREKAREIAYIPQTCHSAFNYSVSDIVLMGTTGGLSLFRQPGKVQRENCQWALEKMGISHLASRCFHRLSGGERQLVMIARALAQHAPILMLDEPTANLDFGNQLLVLRQMKLLANEGYTIIQTTHHPEQSYLYSDQILALQNGSILQFGTPQEVLTEENMQLLYGVDVKIVSMHEDKTRICVPAEFVGMERRKENEL